MIGGEPDVVAAPRPIFDTLAPGTGDIARNAGPREARRHRRAGLSALRPQRRGPFRQDGPQRHRVRRDGRLRRRPRRPARCQRRQAATAPSTPRPRPLRDPEHYQYDLNLRRHRRSLAPRQRHRLVAARPDRRRTRHRIPSSLSSPAASPIRAKAAGRSKPPSTKPCPCRCSPPRCTNASARAAKPTSRTSCCRPCVISSADTWKNQPPNSAQVQGQPMSTFHSDALVFFGATGDWLTRRSSRRCKRW